MENSKSKFDVWVESLKNKIALAPKGSVKLKCKTIINKYGAQYKTKKIDDLIVKSFHSHGIETFPDFHACISNEYIAISLSESLHKPLHDGTTSNITEKDKNELNWLSKKELNSEMSVSIKFVVPLLNLLGYTEEDRSDGYWIEYSHGSKKIKGEADFVLFNGSNKAKSNSLLLVEVKAAAVNKLKNAIDQARSYSLWLGVPYYMITNGNDIRVFHYRDPHMTDQEVFFCHRKELNEETFKDIYSYISKEAIINYMKRKQKGQ